MNRSQQAFTAISIYLDPTWIEHRASTIVIRTWRVLSRCAYDGRTLLRMGWCLGGGRSGGGVPWVMHARAQTNTRTPS